MERQTPLLAPPSRYNKWYEKILLNNFTGHLIALVTLLCTTQLISYQGPPQDSAQTSTLLILAAMYIINSLLTFQISKFPGGRSPTYTLGLTVVVIGITLALLVITRTEYARTSLFIGLSLFFTLRFVAYGFSQRFRRHKFAVVPGCDPATLPTHKNVEWRPLTSTSFEDSRFDGIIVDLKETLSDEWVRFISHANIQGIPVIDALHISELIRGKVDLSSLTVNDINDLQYSPLYGLLKRAIDVFAVLLVAPIVAPFCLLMALIIRIDSPGTALFTQMRIGKGNKPFRIYKFRSMAPTDTTEHRFANEETHRITRVGALIRKTRIDELPQLLNVLMGNMSLVGPRPEQPGFVEEFEKALPLYSYRHMIKPGITGWAQVQQGYACELEETQEKLMHDFYYIKHLSFSMDMLIILKTIRTVLTGFGAK